jgi:hypothetical protein
VYTFGANGYSQCGIGAKQACINVWDPTKLAGTKTNNKSE